MFSPKRLRETRIARGISQAEMERQACVPTRSLTNWESGKHTPDLFNVCLLADVLGVSVDYLCCRTDVMEVNT